MFTVGFGFFLFCALTVIMITTSIYYCNKTDKAASVRIREIELEEKRLEVEKAKYDLQMKELERQM